MVSKNLAFASCHVIILLGVFSFVTGEESSGINAIDYGNSESLLNPALKRRCPGYADYLLCQYFNYLQGLEKVQLLKPSGRDQDPSIPSNETENLREDGGHQRFLGNIPTDKNLEKRFKVFRRQNFFAQGYKRGPGFRSWGGKRDPTHASQDPQKRSKFGAWGGKRDWESWEDPGTTNSWQPESNDKRTRFTNWGGKRDDYDESADKRTRFTNWGGKRDDYDESADKRSKFQSWGGRKRGDDDFQDGGKRDLENEIAYDQIEKRDYNREFRNLYLREPFKKHFPKRPQFQSWGGKRTTPSPWHNLLPFYFHPYQPEGFDNGNAWMGPVKRKFSSWGGKRSDDDEMPEYESSSVDDDEGRNGFGNEIPPAHLINGNPLMRVKRGSGNTDLTTYGKLSSELKSSKEGKQSR